MRKKNIVESGHAKKDIMTGISEFLMHGMGRDGKRNERHVVTIELIL